mgnify:CR=1 FL=1
MTDYEIKHNDDNDRIKTIVISGVSITIIMLAGETNAIIQTSRALTATEENQLKSFLSNRDYKIVYKDGVLQ